MEVTAINSLIYYNMAVKSFIALAKSINNSRFNVEEFIKWSKATIKLKYKRKSLIKGAKTLERQNRKSNGIFFTLFSIKNRQEIGTFRSLADILKMLPIFVIFLNLYFQWYKTISRSLYYYFVPCSCVLDIYGSFNLR